jgi:hypothetical protein
MHHSPLPGKPINFFFSSAAGGAGPFGFSRLSPTSKSWEKSGEFKRLSVGVDSCLIDYLTRTCHVASPTERNQRIC